MPLIVIAILCCWTSFTVMVEAEVSFCFFEYDVHATSVYSAAFASICLFSMAQSSALAPWKEVPSLIPGSVSRPADIYLPNWKRGQPTALDVTVISTLQQQTLVGAANTPGHALKVGEDRKMAACGCMPRDCMEYHLSRSL